MQQLHHFNTHNNQQKFAITLVCDAIRTPQNIGMIFRIAENFGVAKIYFHSTSPTIENRVVKRTARNTICQIENEVYEDFRELITQLKSSNVVIGIELTNKSIELPQFDFTPFQNIVLVLGSERHGILHTEDLDHCVQIAMYGANTSMNVVNSLAITLYEVTNQLVQNSFRKSSIC